MLDPGERKSHECIDCGAKSPEADTNYTLISARHGWRLNRRFGANGDIVLEWRCPACWAKYKQAKLLSQTPIDGVPRAPDSNARPSSREPWPDEPPSSKRGVEPSSRDGRAAPSKPGFGDRGGRGK